MSGDWGRDIKSLLWRRDIISSATFLWTLRVNSPRKACAGLPCVWNTTRWHAGNFFGARLKWDSRFALSPKESVPQLVPGQQPILHIQVCMAIPSIVHEHAWSFHAHQIGSPCSTNPWCLIVVFVAAVTWICWRLEAELTARLSPEDLPPGRGLLAPIIQHTVNVKIGNVRLRNRSPLHAVYNSIHGLLHALYFIKVYTTAYIRGEGVCVVTITGTFFWLSYIDYRLLFWFRDCFFVIFGVFRCPRRPRWNQDWGVAGRRRHITALLCDALEPACEFDRSGWSKVFVV